MTNDNWKMTNDNWKMTNDKSGPEYCAWILGTWFSMPKDLSLLICHLSSVLEEALNRCFTSPRFGSGLPKGKGE